MNLADSLSETLIRSIGRQSILFLGESVHGAREFAQAKQAILERLRDRRVAVVLESGHLECASLPEAVRSGKGEEGMVRSLHRIFQTTDYLELLLAIAERSATDSALQLYGMDCRIIGEGPTVLSTHLQEIAPSLAEEWMEAEKLLYSFTRRGPVHPERLSTYFELLPSILDIYRSCHDLLDGSMIETIDAGRVVRSRIGLAEAASDEDQYFEFREESMAENLVWINRLECDADMVLVLTHNAHAAKDCHPFEMTEKFESLCRRFQRMTDLSVFSLGMYGGKGEVVHAPGSVTPFDTLDAGGVEASLFSSCDEDVILLSEWNGDAENLNGRPLHEFGITPIVVPLADRFDDILFFRTLSPPDFISTSF